MQIIPRCILFRTNDLKAFIHFQDTRDVTYKFVPIGHLKKQLAFCTPFWQQASESSRLQPDWLFTLSMHQFLTVKLLNNMNEYTELFRARYSQWTEKNSQLHIFNIFF